MQLADCWICGKTFGTQAHKHAPLRCMKCGELVKRILWPKRAFFGACSVIGPVAFYLAEFVQ